MGIQTLKLNAQEQLTHNFTSSSSSSENQIL